MKNTSSPEAVVVLEELSPVLPFFYRGMEGSVQQARDFFPEGKPVDPALAPNLVRYYMKEYVDSRSSDDHLPSISSTLSREPLPNNGLYGHVGGIYRIRILKADEGELPLPGPSSARRRFYQQTLPGWARIAGEDWPNPVNLVIIWDVDSEYNLNDLSLACPKGVGDSPGSVEVYWRVDIPHPASIQTNDAESSAIDADAEDFDDLDLTPKERPSTGTEHNGD